MGISNLMNNKLEIKIAHILTLLVCAGMFIPTCGYGDIYKFVTVDGVETFTDAPQDLQARLVIRESRPGKRRKGNRSGAEKTRSISLKEIIEKTVEGSINAGSNNESGQFEAILPPVGGVITSRVGFRVDPIDGRMRYHNGIDIAIPEGTKINPVGSGVIIYSGYRSGYGNTVLVEHPNGMVTLYAHNSRLLAAVGQSVDKKTIIAHSGNTGRSTGPHLHFEAWQAGNNVTAAFLPGSNIQISNTRLASTKVRATFRKQVLSDGSILFTNIPASVP